jgi:predicted amidohydrolase YtcJ
VGGGAAALSPQAAFDAHTSGAWQAAGRAGEGVLVPGARATFAVWRTAGTDVLDLAPGAELPTCLATVRDGTAIYDAGVLGG